MKKKESCDAKTWKISIVILSLLILGSFFMVSCTNEGAIEKGEKYKLSLAHFFPATHPIETELISEWAKAIEEATEGRVVIDSYPGETLGQAASIYDNVINGVADIGVSCFSYTRGRFPVLEAFELPGIVYNTSRAASETAWEGIKELQPQEVSDTKLLMVIATGPGDLFTKKPVNSLDDLRGLEVRATGLSARTLELLGATPVAMAQSEGYESLSKGVVKGNLAPMEVLKTWRHAEVTDYLTRTPFLYNNLFFMTMNIGKWNSLPDDIKDVIETISEKYYREVGISLWDVQNEEALNWAISETEMEVIELSDEEKSKWIEIVEELQQDYIKNLDGIGIDGQEVIDKVKELAKNYNDIY